MAAAADPHAELTAAYEALRSYALGTAPPDQPPFGLRVLLERGLAAWVTWWIARPLPPPPTPRVLAESPTDPLSLIAPVLRPDAVLVLASMALSNWMEGAR